MEKQKPQGADEEEEEATKGDYNLQGGKGELAYPHNKGTIKMEVQMRKAKK